VTALGCVASLLLSAASVNPVPGGLLLQEKLRPPELTLVAKASRGSMPDLSLPSSWPSVRLAAAPEDQGEDDQGSSGQHEPGTPDKKPTERPDAAPPGSLDFDLLGAPAASHQADEHALRLRRTMLNWHQGVGLGLFALQLATTVVGQLNYGDKFGGDNTLKYAQPHAILAYSTVAAFVAAGTLALLAPSPLAKSEGFDRVSLHKLSMFTAAAGMAAEVALGVWTQSREGYLNQQSIGKAHLVVGYVTLAAVAVGIGALVF
jgi:hypothetical protein